MISPRKTDVKNKIGDMAARLLRAAIGRISNDLELLGQIDSAITSSRYLDVAMHGSRPCSSRAEVMDFAIAAAKVNGFVCELGVFRGESLNRIARLLAPHEVYGFDTFTGLPEFWRPGFPEGKFDTSSEPLEFEDNCRLYKGLFGESIPQFLAKVDLPAKLIHIDCDLYSSSRCALDLLAPRMRTGTILVFDEYFNYPGWTLHEHKAFLEVMSTSGMSYKYIAHNKRGEQVAVIITGN
jgi:hypothetical protein